MPSVSYLAVPVDLTGSFYNTYHFLADDSQSSTIQSADKDEQESRAVTGKPHVRCRCKIRFVSKCTATSRGPPCVSTTLVYSFQRCYALHWQTINIILPMTHLLCRWNAYKISSPFSNVTANCLGGAVVERWTRDRKVAGSTPGRGAIKSTRSTQPSIPTG